MITLNLLQDFYPFLKWLVIYFRWSLWAFRIVWNCIIDDFLLWLFDLYKSIQLLVIVTMISYHNQIILVLQIWKRWNLFESIKKITLALWSIICLQPLLLRFYKIILDSLRIETVIWKLTSNITSILNVFLSHFLYLLLLIVDIII